MERCPSGLRCKPGTFVWGKLHRGFESRLLRIYKSKTGFIPVFWFMKTDKWMRTTKRSFVSVRTSPSRGMSEAKVKYDSAEVLTSDGSTNGSVYCEGAVVKDNPAFSEFIKQKQGLSLFFVLSK